MKAAGVALFAGLAIAGCAGPRSQTPTAAAVVPPPAWRTALGNGQPIRADWWAAFGDPVLTGLIERALVNNPNLGSAAARVEEARAQTRLSRAQLLPSISGGAGVSEGRALDAFGNAETSLGAEPTISASYDLDLFGRLRAANAATRALLLASEGARDTVRLGIVSSVATGYITLRALDSRLLVARDTLAARGEGLRIARRRAETGYTSRLELHQAEGEYHATEQLIPQAELSIARQENALRVLLGDVPAAVLRGAALERLATPAIPDGLPADLLRRRPDLFQAEQNLIASDRSLDSARRAFLPNISLTGSVGLVLSSLLPGSVSVFSIGGSILQPIFDGGKLRAQQDIAVSRRDQAAFAYRSVALNAFREVDDSLAGVLRSGQQTVALAGQRDALAAALRNASNRYRAGYSSYLDQLDTQRGLLTAELALVQARADRLNAYVTLYQALGGGWAPSDVQSVSD
ncbi:MAG: efflux transporter outer rane subunit [Sphingomonadales bacterium]|nr:efflux transporter outer rane subunit [Sphingomonadales bacterium]